ncbi:MAG TPA: hypothetical protein VEA16_06305 [Vicinamibacterales bacterium]|nr:hypothetical protein [Vicinamibacterales bacterium]
MARRKPPIIDEHAPSTHAPPGKTRGANGRFTRRDGTDREEDRVREWQEQVKAADKIYEEWEKRFEVKRGEDYFEGKQWHGLPEDQAAQAYVVNMVQAGVETQRPALLFNKPQVRIEPRPSRKDQAAAGVLQQQTKLSQQAVQTFIDDPDVKFMLETGLALRDAHFRFGIVEVGYSADFIDNPHAPRPTIPQKPDEAGEVPEDDEMAPDAAVDPSAALVPALATPMQEPAKVPRPGSETLYVRWIPSKQFRVSLSSKNDLSANDWVGYSEWVRVSDLKANPAYRNTADLKATGTISEKYRENVGVKTDLEQKHGTVRVWKVWDLRARVKHVFAEGHAKFLQEGMPWKVPPFADLKFIERLSEYYPIPVVYSWMGPQDEVNDQREHGRTLRRRSRRRYVARKGAIDPGELEKLQSGPDGVTAWENTEDSVRPMQEGAVDATVWRMGQLAEMDFTMVSGVSSEQRQVASADTATQASIMDARARLRESSARVEVQGWLARIARLMLMQLRAHMVLPFMVKTQLDVRTAQPQEVATTALLWQEIMAKDLGDVDMDVTVDLASLSPVSQDAERVSWNQVLALLTNPTLLMLLTQSETLMRKTLGLYGISSEHEVREISRVAQFMVMMQQMAMASQAQLPGGAAALPPGPGTMAASAGQPGAPGSAQLLAQVENLQ